MADSDPQIRKGGGHPDPEIRWGPGLKKKIFQPFRLQFGPKIRGRGPPGSSTVYYSKVQSIGSCRFQIHLCILACTLKAVMKFLPAQFPWIWCKCLWSNVICLKFFNMTKYRKVLVKYSLLIMLADTGIFLSPKNFSSVQISWKISWKPSDLKIIGIKTYLFENYTIF